MIAPWLDLSEQLPLSQLELVVSAGDRYEAAWKIGQRPVIESYLDEAESAARPYLFRTLLELELELRQLCGEQASRSSYLDRFPEYASILDAVFEQQDDQPTRVLEPSQEAAPDSLHSFNWVPGQTFNGYELVQRLGQGGMGIVFKARQHSAGGRWVALKVVRPDLLGEPSPALRQELLARFQTEVKAAASIDNEHIVPLYEAGEVDGLPYYAMRFVDGENLSDLLERGPLPASRAAELLEPVVRAVAHLHDRKLLHRDIKPRNLILDGGGRLLLTDFGLAKQLEALAVEATISNPMLGTPAYMSPEQARGSGRIGPATDIYSLGATLYEILTGKAPFRGATALEILRQVLDEEPVSPDRIDKGIDSGMARICMKCLRKEPEKRYSDALALADDLARYGAGKTPRARASSFLDQALRWSKRRPALAAPGLVLLVGLPLALGVVYALESRARSTRSSDLIRNLLTVKTEKLLGAIDELRGSNLQIRERLAEAWSSSASGSNEKLRESIALLRLGPQGSQPDVAFYLEGQFDQLDPASLAVACEVLEPWQTELTPHMWSIVRDKGQAPGRRLRAACVLAVWDAHAAAWPNIAGDVTANLIDSSPEDQKSWAQLLKPVASSLEPCLITYFRERTDSEKSRKAAAILAVQFDGNAERLVELAGEAEPYQLRFLAQAFLDNPHSQTVLQAALQDRSAESSPANETSSKRKANLVAVSLRLAWTADQVKWLGRPNETDTLVRSFLIHRLEPVGIEPEKIGEAFDRETNSRVRAALLLALGEYAPDQLLSEHRDNLRAKIVEAYQKDSDGGVHSASEWLLDRWGVEKPVLIPAAHANSGPPESEKGWRLAPNGHTMVVFRDPPEGEIGAKGVNPKLGLGVPLKRIKLPSFAIAAKETTVAQVLALCPGYQMKASDKPATEIDFTGAAIYCNRLSELEGIPREEWFYEGPDANGYVGLAKNFRRKTGYRLPTEEEWEYGCRAGSSGTWFFGDSRDLLKHYVWGLESGSKSVLPVGRLKPNDFGLFDMLGNAEEWCLVDNGDRNFTSQAVRGGSVKYIWFYLHTEDRLTVIPTKRSEYLGFRVARTLARE
jgi:serine/threonine protein kinase/formylglycine-generating enzyme required for sulfatase activity